MSEQDLIEVTCNVTGYPLPTIMWYKIENGTMVKVPNYFTVTADNYSDIVVISNITVGNATPSAAGDYTCIANNTFDTSIENFRVDVQGRLLLLVCYC